MRWKANHPENHNPGTTRAVQKFLLLPACLPNPARIDEWRWFEWATIEQVWTAVDFTEGGGEVRGWSSVRFLNQ